jgi:hypothetical protein
MKIFSETCYKWESTLVPLERMITAASPKRRHYPMLSWLIIKQIINEGGLEKLGRSLLQHEKYVEFCDQLRLSWNSVTDFIMCSKLSFTQITLSNGKWAAERSELIERRSVLIRNDFPYNFEPGIDHYVLWKIGGELELDEVFTFAQQLVNDEKAIDFATYINPPHLKSILDLDHAHILLKRR